jgi:serine/threonine protein kinase HipA of HipAB toxin-antitoxin module
MNNTITELCRCGGGLVIFVVGWWICFQIAVAVRKDQAKAHQAARKRRRSSVASVSDSPLGLVDDEEDEWLEFAIMDDC